MINSIVAAMDFFLSIKTSITHFAWYFYYRVNIRYLVDSNPLDSRRRGTNAYKLKLSSRQVILKITINYKIIYN